MTNDYQECVESVTIESMTTDRKMMPGDTVITHGIFIEIK